MTADSYAPGPPEPVRLASWVIPKTRYARSGNVSIAYQVVGDGPLDIVMVPGALSHVEFIWTDPAWARFYERYASFARLILFDKRGTGMSDRDVGIASLEERRDDVRAVMDAAGCQRAALHGASEGGPMAALFAATYPDRTSALILYGTFPRVAAAADWPGLTPEEMELRIEHAAANFGEGGDLEVFAPSVAGDPTIKAWWATLERMASSPSAARALAMMNFEIDVRSVLPAIQTPTLVLHRRGDRVIPLFVGEYLASHIPNSQLVVLEGDDHAPYGDIEDWVGAVEEFLTGVRHEAPLDRVLATVVFTDIVGSTDLAARMGDAAWRLLLDRHDQAARQVAKRHSGRLVKTMGDGTLVTFDGPARAARFASELTQGAEGLGFRLRAGLHTGEVEVRGDDVGGLAVHIAARISALAGAGDVLASRTVKDLTAGSGLVFVDRGTHCLKGVPDEWQLYEVRDPSSP